MICLVFLLTYLRRKRRFSLGHRRHRCRDYDMRNSQYPCNWLPRPLGWSDKDMRTIRRDSQIHRRRRKVVCPRWRFDLPAHSSVWLPFCLNIFLKNEFDDFFGGEFDVLRNLGFPKCWAVSSREGNRLRRSIEMWRQFDKFCPIRQEWNEGSVFPAQRSHCLSHLFGISN